MKALAEWVRKGALKYVQDEWEIEQVWQRLGSALKTFQLGAQESSSL